MDASKSAAAPNRPGEIAEPARRHALPEDVSVLMPVHLPCTIDTALDGLHRAIRSVTAERFPGRMELLLIDDGSPSAVEKHLDRSSVRDGQSLRIIRLERNRGIVHALNRGLAEAAHPLIARIDADDEWLPGKIEAQVACLRSNPDITIVGTGMWIVPTRGGLPVPGDRWRGGWSGALRFTEREGSPLPHGSILARRDIFRLLGGYSSRPAARHVEDYALWSVWLRFFQPALCEGIHYRYSSSPDSISGRHAKEQRSRSERIRAELRRLDIADRIPSAISEIASILGLTEVQAGVLGFRLWRDRPVVACPEAAVAPLRRLLPDRAIGRAMLPRLRRPRTVEGLLEGFGEPARPVHASARELWRVR